MARPQSGDSPARFSDGSVGGQQDRTDSATSTVADEQTLGDSEQTLSEANPHAHEFRHRARETSTGPREPPAPDGAGARLRAADRRDELADARDLAAQLRDDAAAARSIAMAELDALVAQENEGRGQDGAGAMIRAAGRRRRAAERRAQAAAYRERAAEDRLAAARDRAQAAQERLDALADREALAVALQHEQRRRDEALRHQHRAEKLARTLRRSLSPPRLPHVAGLDVAVHYEPVAREDVGGDFYDLFPLAAGRTGFFLGDVCGKGPEAAAVTSLARYTMRTAAMLRERPDAILGDLNAALTVEGGAESLQTCTAIYGQIDMSSAGASIILAAAGHPAPLVVRSGGAVETTSAQGTMLGAVEQPVFQTCEVTLAAGDAIVIYSDGILDTAIDGVRVDEERVLELLGGPPHASAAELVDRLLSALQRIDRPLRDDVALMALQRTPAA